MAEEERRHLRTSSSAILVQDKAGAQHLIELLHTIHRSVLEAIILNTIAHEYKSSDDFHTLFYNMDDCAGSYLVTFVINNSTRGLSRLQWKEIGEMVSRYNKGKGRIITPRSSAQSVADAEEAIKIEQAYRRRGVANVSADVRAGKRHMAFAAYLRFVDILKLRMSPALDPAGTTRQIQVPCQIGCSRHLQTRVSAHDPLEGVDDSAKPMSLVISCLNVKGYFPQALRLPILKIWSADQLRVSEVGLTMLASSMIAEGGLNCQQPGNQDMGDEPAKFVEALNEIFIRNTWTTANFEHSDDVIERRLDTLKMVEEVLGKPALDALLDKKKPEAARFEKVTKDLREAMRLMAEGVSEEVEATEKRKDVHCLKIKAKEGEFRTALEEGRDRLDQLTAALANKEAELRFRKEVEAWLRRNDTGVSDGQPGGEKDDTGVSYGQLGGEKDDTGVSYAQLGGRKNDTGVSDG